ncbi:EAL domain-containing protein [Sulfurimonas sp. HSL-1716]|uniref:EAL domain-containing protein n=1 Tax=Hydrocurvibacter sulfurireducens TaxID=3131937 RepID=UPI0031F91A65
MYLHALNLINDLVFIHDSEYKIVFANNAYLRLCGKKLEEVAGRPYYKILPLQEAPFKGCLKELDSDDDYENSETVIFDNHSYLSRALKFKLPDIAAPVFIHVLEKIIFSPQILTILNHIPQKIFIKDLNLKYLFCNKYYADDLKLASPELIVGKDDMDFHTKEIAKKYRFDDLRIIKERRSQTFEEPYVLDGKTSIVRTFKTPFCDHNGHVIGIFGIFEDVTEQVSHRQTMLQLHTLLDTIPDLVWLKDKEGVFLVCNPVFERFVGAKEEVIIGKTDYDFVDKELADLFREKDKLAMSSDKPNINEEWVTFADDGHKSLLETIKTPMYDDKHDLIGVLGIARDITERYENQEHIKRLNRIYATLSQCNMDIVHSTNADELFEKICKNAVELGDMSMAWIGIIDKETKMVHPVASHGDENRYLKGIEISVDKNSLSGVGPTGISIREDHPVWCQDFMNDPSTKPWHEKGERMGWKSSASLPIRKGGEVIGAFTLYSKIKNGFDPMSQKLIEEIAMDVSFAMENFEREAKRKESENRLKKTEKLLEDMSQVAHIGGWDFDPQTGAGEWTAEVARIHDMDPDDPTSKEMGLSVYDDVHLKKIQDAIDKAVKYGISYDLELKMTTLKGNEKWVRVIGTPVIKKEKVVRIRGSMQDITIQKTAQERIQWLAHFDALTELPNRALFNDRVQHSIKIAQRMNNPLSVLSLDLDNFKNINDTLGHDIGDLLLVEVSSRIKSVMREEDTLSRQGGDEFIMLLPGTDADGAAHVAEKITEVISRPYRIKHQELYITPSIGIAMYPIDGEDFQTLFQSADAAMYHAKHDGRNCYRFFTSEIQSRAARNLELENGLRHALERNEFELHYQPQIQLGTNRLVGAEALIRWRHPKLGMISPAEFVPIAENGGQIIAIGEWVLRTALRQLKEWIENGIEPFVMAINISAIQFRHPKLVSSVLDILQEFGLPPESIELELTEGVAMENPLKAIDIMNEFHQNKIRMAIDDFGTGYSSMSYLKKFSVHKLKIDRSFIQEITHNLDDRMIVKTIINMAHNLNMKTIAEGVETKDQLELLRQSRCDEIQGYYFSKPLPSKEFEAFVGSRVKIKKNE